MLTLTARSFTSGEVAARSIAAASLAASVVRPGGLGMGFRGLTRNR